jgi:hypothetical protein
MSSASAASGRSPSDAGVGASATSSVYLKEGKNAELQNRMEDRRLEERLEALCNALTHGIFH